MSALLENTVMMSSARAVHSKRTGLWSMCSMCSAPFLDHRFMRVCCSIIRPPNNSVALHWSTLASLWLRCVFWTNYQNNSLRRTLWKMTSGGAAAFLSHMHFYCTSHQWPTVRWPDHVERSSTSHRQRYNQNNISNWKRLWSSMFCFVVVLFFL